MGYIEDCRFKENMSEVVGIIQKVAQEAGKAILAQRMDFDVAEKTKGEIVTPADKIANQIIVERLKAAYPNAGFSSEEQGEEGEQEQTRFIIDPLDGTTGKVWGGSGYTISIAQEVNGLIQVGAVFDPEHNEFFYAVRGHGAYRNNNKLKVSPLNKIEQAFVSCDWGNADDKRNEGLEYYKKLLLPEMAERRIVPRFAPANDLVRIAEGRIHALVCNDTWLEDHAAGALILQEAGDFVRNFYRRDKFDHKIPGIIAANNERMWLQLIKKVF